MIDARQRNVALLVAGCFFMEMLDGTIVTTASPQIARSLHAQPAEIGLVVTAYLLTLAVLIPLSGWLTRRFGNRAVFLTAITVFTLASVGCAVSVSLGELVAMRVLQGVGGAMMVPVGRTMVVSMADKRDLLRITSYVVWPGLLAPVIAPLAGGLITTYASWHWIFLINVPLGAVAFCVAWRLVRGGETGAPPPLDLAGVLLTCAGLGALTYAAHLVSLAAPPPAQTAAFGAAAAALLAGAVWHLRRAPHPLLNLRTLGVDTFRASQLGGSLYWLVVGAAPFLLPLLFQTQFGWSPVKSGAVVLFIFAGNVGIKPATTPLINRHHPVDRADRLQHCRLRRHARRVHAGRQHPVRDDHPARGRPRDRGRHGRAARRGPVRRRQDRVHGGILPARRDLAGRGRRSAPAAPRGRRRRAPAVPVARRGLSRDGFSGRRAGALRPRRGQPATGRGGPRPRAGRPPGR